MSAVWPGLVLSLSTGRTPHCSSRVGARVTAAGQSLRASLIIYIYIALADLYRMLICQI
jgi:hypothetical protein